MIRGITTGGSSLIYCGTATKPAAFIKEQTGIDLQGEALGILPSREWKRRNRRQPWYPGETVIMGIGQGYFLSTPLQLAAATAALAGFLAQSLAETLASLVAQFSSGDARVSPKYGAATCRNCHLASLCRISERNR